VKPNLKPPGTERLKLKCDILLSTCALKFNLRRFDLAYEMLRQVAHWPCSGVKAGAYTRPRFSST
jgi:hypothetical protein